MVSFDVKAIFTSVPVDPAIQIAQQKLQLDPTLQSKTNMSIPHIISLLRFCHKTYTSSSRVSIMSQYMVQPWVPPSAPNLFMEEFEFQAPSNALTPIFGLGLWMASLLFIRQNTVHHNFNTSTHQNPHIQFTIKEPNPTRITTIFGHSDLPGPTTQSSPHPTGNKHTEINIFTGTNTVYTTIWHTGQR